MRQAMATAGESLPIPPTVFRGQWTPDVKQNLVSLTNPKGKLSISDLEMAGLLIMFLVMEAVTPNLAAMHVAMFSKNVPTVSWVRKLASKRSLVGARLVRALALQLKIKKCSPITPLHIAGRDNAMADMASQSFGSVPHWHCKSDTDFSTKFNTLFPLPSQNTWSVFHLHNKLFT